MFFTRSNSISGQASSLLGLGNVLEETRLFRFERVRTFTIVSAGKDCFILVHANIARYHYILVTKGNSTLLFFTRE